MNQILDYSPNKGNNKSSGSDKIVHFFAVIMIIFAIVLIAGAGFNLYQRNKESKTEVVEEKANIEVIQEETKVSIKVTHTKAVEKIIYSWNNGKETTIKSTGESNVQEAIPLPKGENTLHIKVLDIDGGASTYESQFSSETGEDILNPKVELIVKKLEQDKVIIRATDETSLDFITYRWNDQEEVKVEPTDDKTKIEIEIDILEGKNDLTVSAVDSNNNTTTDVKSYTGLNQPEVMIVVAADKKSADVTVKHDKGLKEVKVVLNDVEHPMNIGAENPKEIMFKVQLADGINNLIIKATSLEETQIEAVEVIDNNGETSTEEQPSTQEPTEEQPSTQEPTEEQPSEENPTTDGLQISIEKTEDGQSVYYKITDPSGIKELKLNLNDMDLDLSPLGELGPNATNIEFTTPLYDGNNKITLTAVSVEGTEKQELKEIVK